MTSLTLPSRVSAVCRRTKPLLHSLLVAAVLILPGFASAGNLTGRFTTINLDGNLADWQPGDTMYSASEISLGAPLNATFTNVMVANDANFLYVALQLPAASAITDPWTYNLYLDTDMGPATGFNSGWMTAGYDRLVQYGSAGTTYSTFGFSGVNQSAWSWNWLGLINYSYSDRVIEWGIPLSALALTGNQMRMEFNATGNGVTAETWAYQWESGVGTYTIAVVPEPASLALLGLAGLGLALQARRRKALKACRNLALLVLALAGPQLASAGNLTGRFTTINLDGSLADWQPGDTMYSASEISLGAPLNATFTNVYVANDSNYVYVALALPAPAAITNDWTYSIFIDADMITTSGFNGGWMSGGYDHLVQYGAAGTTYSVYNFTGANQADWSWNWLSLIDYSYTDLVIEWRIPVSSLGLTTNKMRMEFNVTGTGITTETWAYQWESGVGTYTLASAPPTSPPTITALEGAPNKIQVTFSKPVTPATAGAVTNYSLSGGLTVLSATPNALNPRQVTLTTSSQTRGNSYTLTVNGVKDEAGNPIAANSHQAFVSSILLDGSSEDWEGLPALYFNSPGNPSATDFAELYAYNDANYLYFRVTLWEPSELFTAQNNIFLDTDNNSSSGNLFWGGSELLIQGGVGYQEKYGTNFNEGLINGLDLVAANSGQTNYEFRISLAATYASDGLPVFTTNVVNVAFDGESNWVTVNRMPPFPYTTIPYSFVAPPAPLGPLSISLSAGQITVTWPGPGTLQACDSLTSLGWTNVPAQPSYYTTAASGGLLFFRLTQ